MGLESPLKDLKFLKPQGRWILVLAVAGAIGTTAFGLYKIYELRKAQETPPPPVVSTPAKIEVTALGRLEPQGELIQLSAASSLEGTRLTRLLVKQGDKVQPGQVIAILDTYEQRLATQEEAKKQVQVAQANLAKVKAGAKGGEIAAQKADISRLQAQLNGEIATQRAIIARLEAQLSGERKTQQATVLRLQAQLDGERNSQQATILRLQAQLSGERNSQQATILRWQAQLRNAAAEFERYQMLYKQGAIEPSRFDSKRLELETAQEHLNEAKASLKRIEETLLQQVNEAKATLTKTDRTLVQQINEAKATLTQTEETLREQINEAKATRNQTANTLQEQSLQAKATLNQISEVRPTDMQAAQAEVESAIATVKKTQVDLDLALVRSPLAGQILKINARPGERIGDNGIVELGQTDQMYVVAEVYETEISQVRLGQPATVQSSAFPGKLQGTVDQLGLKIGKKNILNDDPAAQQDARVVEVKIRLAPEDSKQVTGLTNLQVEVAIDVTSSPPNSTAIPESSPRPEK